jgi:hypothetical protein
MLNPKSWCSLYCSSQMSSSWRIDVFFAPYFTVKIKPLWLSDRAERNFLPVHLSVCYLLYGLQGCPTACKLYRPCKPTSRQNADEFQPAFSHKRLLGHPIKTWTVKFCNLQYLLFLVHVHVIHVTWNTWNTSKFNALLASYIYFWSVI